MKFLIVNTDYPDFLHWLYHNNPGLERQGFEEQYDVRMSSLFSVADFYSSNLQKIGHEAWDVQANNECMQNAWAREHGVKAASNGKWQLRLRRGIVPWASRVKDQTRFYDILAAQIKHYKPDILLNQAMDGISTGFLHAIKSSVKLLIGQHAATQLSEAESWSVYDLVISSFTPTVEWFRSRGIPAKLHRLGFEPRVLSHLRNGERKEFCSFVGSFHPVHDTRVQWLECLCDAFPVKVWSPDVHHLPASSSIRRSYVGSVWGTEMYQVLRDSVLTFNHHGNVPPYANNLRLFEATGVGTLLLTDHKINLAEMFEPGREVVQYRNADECAELAKYYMEHESERRAIARAGQERTLGEHTYYHRMQEMVSIVSQYL